MTMRRFSHLPIKGPGRSLKWGEPTQHVSMRLPNSKLHVLDHLAETLGVSRSEVVVLAIELLSNTVEKALTELRWIISMMFSEMREREKEELLRKALLHYLKTDLQVSTVLPGIQERTEVNGDVSEKPPVETTVADILKRPLQLGLDNVSEELLRRALRATMEKYGIEAVKNTVLIHEDLREAYRKILDAELSKKTGAGGD